MFSKKSSMLGAMAITVAIAAAMMLANVNVVRAENEELSGDELYHRGFYEEAREAWQREAANGDSNAAYRIGVLYHDGVVVKRDYEKAYYWYMLAAEAGNARAQFDLATLYDLGLGVTRDLEQAAHWYLRAANQGQAAGQYNVAVMYEDGDGIPQDFIDSYFWYYVSTNQDFYDFRGNSLERVAQHMEPKEVLETTVRAQSFEPVIELEEPID